MNKCIGCGVETEKELCERCFRIKNYNDYKNVFKDNSEFISILKNIDNKSLVVLVADLFNIGDLSIFKKYIDNDILLVLTKRDLLPRSLYEEKLLNYDYNLKAIDKIIISSNKNYQMDELINKINKYRKTEKVYFIGYTNAGKSTLINYSDIKTTITTSPLPNTTLNTIDIKFNDMILVDTPGLLDDGDIINYIDKKDIKKVIPTKEIKPITYQIKGKQTLIIDNYLKVEANDIDLTFFISNNLKIDRYYKNIETNNLEKHIINVDSNDIVIKGLGFIKTNKKSVVTIYTLKEVSVFTRKTLI